MPLKQVSMQLFFKMKQLKKLLLLIEERKGKKRKELLDRSVPNFLTDAKYILMGKNPIQDGEKINP